VFHYLKQKEQENHIELVEVETPTKEEVVTYHR
jgi:hypothetical protein